jgi:hypothetical protein
MMRFNNFFIQLALWKLISKMALESLIDCQQQIQSVPIRRLLYYVNVEELIYLVPSARLLTIHRTARTA